MSDSRPIRSPVVHCVMDVADCFQKGYSSCHWLFVYHHQPWFDHEDYEKVEYVYQKVLGDNGNPVWAGYVKLPSPRCVQYMRIMMPGALFARRWMSHSQAIEDSTIPSICLAGPFMRMKPAKRERSKDRYEAYEEYRDRHLHVPPAETLQDLPHLGDWVKPKRVRRHGPDCSCGPCCDRDYHVHVETVALLRAKATASAAAALVLADTPKQNIEIKEENEI